MMNVRFDELELMLVAMFEQKTLKGTIQTLTEVQQLVEEDAEMTNAHISNSRVPHRSLRFSGMMLIKSWWAFTSTLRGIRKSTNARKWCICSKIAKMVP